MAEYLITKRIKCLHCRDGKVNGKQRQDYTFNRVPCPKCDGKRQIDTQVDLLEALGKVRWMGTDGSVLGFIPSEQRMKDVRIEEAIPDEKPFTSADIGRRDTYGAEIRAEIVEITDSMTTARIK